jgi:hypothetical protein
MDEQAGQEPVERGETGGQPPVQRETARLADLPVEGFPADAPDAPRAAADDAPDRPDPGATAHDPQAERGPKSVMAAYAAAMAEGDAALAADLYASDGLLTSADRRLQGRDDIAGWHRDLFAEDAVVARPSGQGNDAGRLEVEAGDQRWVVELSFDASGRIGTARWLTPDEAGMSQEDRQRTAT